MIQTSNIKPQTPRTTGADKSSQPLSERRTLVPQTLIVALWEPVKGTLEKNSPSPILIIRAP